MSEARKAALARGADEDLHLFLDRGLTEILVQPGRSDAGLDGGIFVAVQGIDQAVFHGVGTILRFATSAPVG